MSEFRSPLGVGRILGQTFSLLFANGRIWSAALVFGFLSALLDGWIAARMPEGAPGEAFPALSGGTAVLYLLVLLASLVLSAFFTGYLCLLGVDAVIGRSHAVGQYARQAARHLLPLLVLSLALGLLVGLGFVLFIVPGIYFIGRYLPWIETVAFEDRGWQGLGRAQDLTEGYRWPIAGAALLFGLAVLVIAVVFGLGAYAISGGTAMEILFNTVFSAFSYAAAALFTALVYVRLREIKEGAGPVEIAATLG